MRAQGKIRELFNPITKSREWSRYPATREEAYIEDVAKYYPPVVCPDHGERSVYFTATGIAACCANRKAVDAYNEAIAAGEPHTLTEAQRQGKNYFWLPQPNPYCGHPGKIHFDGRCVFCLEERKNSPRQRALRAGATEYMPRANDPCPNGHIALRRVDNGSCKQCREEAKGKTAAGGAEGAPINKLVPDMVIDRKSARGLGFKVYRTGKACGVGHTGWRYVSTGGCIDCKNGVAPPAT